MAPLAISITALTSEVGWQAVTGQAATGVADLSERFLEPHRPAWITAFAGMTNPLLVLLGQIPWTQRSPIRVLASTGLPC